MSQFVQQILHKAKNRAKCGEYSQAFDLYYSILQKFPANKRALAGLNASRVKMNKANTIDPPTKQINELITLYGLGDMQAVVDAATPLARQYPNALFLLNILGSANAAMQYLQPAVDNFRKAIAIKPDYAEAHNNLGNALKDQGKIEQAITCYRDALCFNPDLAAASKNLGNTMVIRGQHIEALEVFERTANRHPASVAHTQPLVDYLNDFSPPEYSESRFAKASGALADISFDVSGSAKNFYCKSIGILRKQDIDFFTHESQIFRGRSTELDCDRHKKIFDRFTAIPEFCFGCYKVQIAPKTIVDLFGLLRIFTELRLPANNTRKCMVELRPGIPGSYKGLIYCDGLQEAQHLQVLVGEIIAEQLQLGTIISVKHGCSEFEQSFPDYGTIIHSDGAEFKYDPAWKKHERFVDEHLIPLDYGTSPNRNTESHCVSIGDALIMKNWLAYAKCIGDESYREIDVDPQKSDYITDICANASNRVFKL